MFQGGRKSRSGDLFCIFKVFLENGYFVAKETFVFDGVDRTVMAVRMDLKCHRRAESSLCSAWMTFIVLPSEPVCLSLYLAPVPTCEASGPHSDLWPVCFGGPLHLFLRLSAGPSHIWHHLWGSFPFPACLCSVHPLTHSRMLKCTNALLPQPTTRRQPYNELLVHLLAIVKDAACWGGARFSSSLMKCDISRVPISC